MKKILLFSALIMLSAFVMAQNIKKVAVWETKCTDNSITSFQSTMVRGGMETAVGNTPGYKVYDRSSFDAIMKEQNFQRSGAVSDEDIKRMGVMAGVQYIIVPEATADGNEFYILVKMLDVETGEFGAVYEELCGPSGSEIRQACSNLGAQLFGSSGGTKSRTTNYNVAQDYVDLGLKSGTKWKSTNEPGLIDYNTAINQYGGSIPTIYQWAELKSYCKWEWTGSGYIVTGPNGNHITLPANGFREFKDGQIYNNYTSGYYWMRDNGNDKDNAKCLLITSSLAKYETLGTVYGFSVRLVK